MDEKVTNKKYINSYVALAFADFKLNFPSIIYSRKDIRITGHSDSLSAGCATLATTYLNHIVENFKKRFFHYVYNEICEIYPVCFFKIIVVSKLTNAVSLGISERCYI
jgi:hypothetical protein